jgi:hypothetical protein
MLGHRDAALLPAHAPRGVNDAGDDDRLPPTIGGLIDLGLAAWAQRAPLYVGLSTGMFVLCGAIETLWPARTESAAAIKELVLIYTELFALAFVIAAAALGVATRVSGESVSARTLLTGALERWPAVLGAIIVVLLVVMVTGPFAALGKLPDPPLLALLTAPVIWLLWGVVNLAGPIAALSGDRPLIALLASFPRAIALSLRRGNLVRVCVLGFVTIVPTLIASILFDVLGKRGASHVTFWANLPVDAITAAPVAAIQTAFALDFARRAGTADDPPR